jgi:hypothetical protein
MDASEYIRKQDDMFLEPVVCDKCGDEVDTSGMVRVDKDRNPLCEKHEAFEMVTVERHCGTVNNSLHPETGEPGYFEDTESWYEVTDSKIL